MTTIAGKTVVVTGADGFIGSHLAERLVREGAKVRAFCLYNSHNSWGWLDSAPADIKRALDVQLGDVRDARFVEKVCTGADVVLHLAALIAIPYSYVAPESFVDTNVKGTMNVLEAVRRQNVGRMVHTSTSEVYGTPATLPITESHPLNAQSPYAATKVAADQLALSYHRSFATPVMVLRPFNTFGPRQSSRAILPSLLHQLLSGKTRIELGRTDTRRDFTFVDDTVAGFLAAATAPGVEGETVQLGTNHAVSIAEAVEAARQVVGVKELEVVTAKERLRPDPSEVMVLLSDPARAKQLLGWEPKVTFSEGLARTAAWIRDNLTYFKEGFHV